MGTRLSGLWKFLGFSIVTVVFDIHQDILGSRVDHKRSQIKVHNIINHYKFSKEMLDNAKARLHG